MEATRNNRSYIVRMWREQDSGVWRAMVQDVTDTHDGLRHHTRRSFPSLAAMMTYFCRLIEDIESDHTTSGGCKE